MDERLSGHWRRKPRLRLLQPAKLAAKYPQQLKLRASAVALPAAPSHPLAQLKGWLQPFAP